ncbi:hypothetical protein OXYTRIMIC_771 [Oxytricha trifallax]|uniref:Uncharacterized protein n=1 Tax=Oxytricha trifallax TaxID=1172189 RepID=A0A073I0G9_9SPIT|nr:hypothetical protein OXYTRIMIC_771 [Oxytricha trifallax]
MSVIYDIIKDRFNHINSVQQKARFASQGNKVQQATLKIKFNLTFNFVDSFDQIISVFLKSRDIKSIIQLVCDNSQNKLMNRFAEKFLGDIKQKIMRLKAKIDCAMEEGNDSSYEVKLQDYQGEINFLKELHQQLTTEIKYKILKERRLESFMKNIKRKYGQSEAD